MIMALYFVKADLCPLTFGIQDERKATIDEIKNYVVNINNVKFNTPLCKILVLMF